MSASRPDWTLSLGQGLAEARAQGMGRRLRERAAGSGVALDLDGRALVHFAGNDYLGLSAHPRVLAAAKAALDAYGAGTGASRLVGGGTLALHAELEAALARFKGMPSALVFAAGSLANLGLLSCLVGEGDLVVLDKACHATLYDGARLSGARLLRFPHQNLERLDALLTAERGTAGRALVVVEGVYSMDGDLAPLPGLLELTARHGALLVVDEAHSTGVLGPTGRGILEHFGLSAPGHLILSGTLSKALGSLGGYVAGPELLREHLIQNSRSFIYATALPASCAGAALEALRVIQSEPALLRRLWENRAAIVQGLEAQGWSWGTSQSPILPVVVGGAEAAVALEQKLWEAGYYVPAMRPPTVPAGSCRLRLSVGAGHEPGHITGLLQALGTRA